MKKLYVCHTCSGYSFVPNKGYWSSENRTGWLPVYICSVAAEVLGLDKRLKPGEYKRVKRISIRSSKAGNYIAILVTGYSVDYVYIDGRRIPLSLLVEYGAISDRVVKKLKKGLVVNISVKIEV